MTLNFYVDAFNLNCACLMDIPYKWLNLRASASGRFPPITSKIFIISRHALNRIRTIPISMSGKTPIFGRCVGAGDADS